jgi:hypothetical protein
MEVASRLAMRSRVRLKLTQSNGEVILAEGLVAWARVAAIVDKQVNYLVAVIFDKAIPDLGGMDVPPALEVAAPHKLEAPQAPDMAAPRDNLTWLPAPVLRVPEALPVVDAWSETEEHLASLDVESCAGHTDAAIGQAAEHLVALSAVNDSLTAQLAQADADRDALRDNLESERRVREEERAKLLQEAAAAVTRAVALQSALAAREEEHAQVLASQQARCEALQSAFDSREQEHILALAEHQSRYDAIQSAFAMREQEHVLALAEQKAGYEALTAELLQASHDQQVEYQLLLDERTASREEERLRGEAHALELARVQEEGTQEREQLELRCLDIQARFDAAESLCSAHDARVHSLRREIEKLMCMITTPVLSAAFQQDDNAAASEQQSLGKQAVV